ncbi:RidA family protein [Pseudorhodoferax sp.]|uniref:RidA family protein n=1 Tax=Pseudorhodoferax sp. TaxID=1993553 RepID=UPI002DD646FE|nr:RidA family protein [Pseudorhodoferax sp.]
MSADAVLARLHAAGHRLPAPPLPRGLYAPSCRMPLDAGRAWVHVAGQTCRVEGVALAGLCSGEADVAPAARAAEVAVLNALAALHAGAGGLARVQQIVRLRGFVRSAPGFLRHAAVLDGASRVLAAAFPDQPPPARTAVGVASLPDAAWIEIELEAVVAA